jgi:flagellar biosynthetic protein FliQ
MKRSAIHRLRWLGEPIMDATHVIDWSREALRMALLLGGPPLLAALAVAVVVGMVQTVTQMHEPIVAQVPRQVVVLLVVLLALPWMLGLWVSYARELIGGLGGS